MTVDCGKEYTEGLSSKTKKQPYLLILSQLPQAQEPVRSITGHHTGCLGYGTGTAQSH
jgi:hypothetical protein